MNWIKRNLLSERREGTSTFEFVLTLPFAMILLFFTIFISLFTMSYINYNSLASNVAGSMNFRTTGIKNVNNAINSGYYIDPEMKKITSVNGDSSDSDFKNCVLYMMQQHRNQWGFPYCTVNSVNAYTFRESNSGSYQLVTLSENKNTAANYANVIVKVTINYTFVRVNLGGLFMPAIECNSTGYSVMT